MDGRDHLYERLRAAILDGDFRPGAVLAETQLAEQFGTSRTPVREALSRLEQDAIVYRVGRQLRVRPTTPEEVLEIYDCRTVLEGMAAQWAARMRSDYDIALLEGALRRMESLTDFTPHNMSLTNQDFHVALWRASHNATLFDLLERLEAHIRRYPEPTVSQPGRWGRAVDEHRAILTAIKDGEADHAHELSSSHMRAARDLRLTMIRDTPTPG